jgi:hypothetical protein
MLQCSMGLIVGIAAKESSVVCCAAAKNPSQLSLFCKYLILQEFNVGFATVIDWHASGFWRMQ